MAHWTSIIPALHLTYPRGTQPNARLSPLSSDSLCLPHRLTAHQTRRIARRRRVSERACRRPFRLDHRFACGHHYMIFYDTQAHTERVHHTFEHLLIPITPGQSIADRPHSALPSRPRLPQHEISRKTLALQITAHPPNPINHSSDNPPPSPTNPPIPAPNIARTAVTAHPLIPHIPVRINCQPNPEALNPTYPSCKPSNCVLNFRNKEECTMGN